MNNVLIEKKIELEKDKMLYDYLVKKYDYDFWKITYDLQEIDKLIKDIVCKIK